MNYQLLPYGYEDFRLLLLILIVFNVLDLKPDYRDSPF
jgi:hypothetical protein